MNAHPLIAARVSPDTKNRLRVVAEANHQNALLQAVGVTPAATGRVEPVVRGARLYVRLRHEDHLLLRERATARGLEKEGQPELAQLVRRFVHAMPPPMTERQSMAEHLRRVREQGDPAR